MTLIHVDQSSENLLNPTVNAPDVQGNPQAHGTSSLSPRAPGSTAGKLITKDSRIIANDGTNNIGLFGFDDAGNMVVKIAAAGYDANSAADVNLVFNSGRVTMQIIAQGNFSITGGTVSNGNLLTRTTTVSYPAQATLPIVLAFHTDTANLGQVWSGMVPSQWTTGSTAITFTKMELFTMNVGLSSTDFTNRTDNSTGSSVSASPWAARYFVLNQFQS